MNFDHFAGGPAITRLMNSAKQQIKTLSDVKRTGFYRALGPKALLKRRKYNATLYLKSSIQQFTEYESIFIIGLDGNGV